MTATGTSQLGVRLTVPEVKRSNRAPVTMQGWLYKQGSEGLMLWKKRWFVLSEYCLFYYKNSNEEKVLGSILLPSYKISPCSTAEGNLFKKKFSFKAEHANVRTYYFAADSKDEMIRWMNAMCLATIAQEHRVIASVNNADNRQPPAFRFVNDTDTSTTGANKPCDYLERTIRENMRGSDESGVKPAVVSATLTMTNNQPLYVNAPPKPRRYNETPCSDRTYGGGCTEMENFVLAHTAYPTPDKYSFRNDESLWPVRKRTISTGSTYQSNVENNSPSNGYRSAADPALLYNGAVQKPHNYRSDTPIRSESRHNDVDDEDRRFFNTLNLPHNQVPSTTYSHGRSSNERPRSVDVFLQPSYRNDSPQQPPSSAHQTTDKPRTQWPDRRNISNSNRRDASKHSNATNLQPPPRPKSSIDMATSDHFHWSAEQYAQNMRRSAQFLLVSKARQLPFAAAAAAAAAASSSGRNVGGKSTDADVESVTARTVTTTTLSNDHSSQSHFTAALPAIAKQSAPNCRDVVGPGILPTNSSTSRGVNDFIRSKSARLSREKQYADDEFEKDRQNIRSSTRQNYMVSSTAAARAHSSSPHHIDQREESMKRLLEWKQRMLQSPLTRKSASSRTDEREVSGQRLTMQNTLTNTINIVDKLSDTQTNCIEDRLSNHNGNNFDHDRDLSMICKDVQYSPNRYAITDIDRLSAASRNSERLSLGEGLSDKISTVNSKSNHKPYSSPLPETTIFSQSADIAATAHRLYSPSYKPYNDANSILSENNAADCFPGVKLDKHSPIGPSPSSNDVARDLPRQNLVQDRIKAFERIPSGSAGKTSTENVVGANSKTSPPASIPSSVPIFTSLSSTLSRTIPLANLTAYDDFTRIDSTDECSDKTQRKNEPDDVSAAKNKARIETNPNKISSANLTSKGIYLGAEEKIDSLSNDDYRTLRKTSSSLSIDRRLTEVNEPSNQLSSVEDHYLPMAPSKKTVFNGTNDLFYHTRSNSASSASQIMILETLLSEDNENSYVEMTVGDDRSSVGSAINKSNGSAASVHSHTLPKVMTASSQKLSNVGTGDDDDRSGLAISDTVAADKSHYEFLYRASSSLSSLSSPSLPQLLEPLYMEVSSVKESSISTIKNDEKASETAPLLSVAESEDSHVAHPVILPDILNTSNMHQLQTDGTESGEDGDVGGGSGAAVDKDRHPINMPAHPRFSLSDTFRPASYYLGGSCTTGGNSGTLGARSTLGLCFDQPDSSDSDLVSPPPIPATVPSSQLDDLNVSLDTVKNENETSNVLHSGPFSYSVTGADSPSNKDYNLSMTAVDERPFYTDQITGTDNDGSHGEYKQSSGGSDSENMVFQLRNHFRDDDGGDVIKSLHFQNTLAAPYYYADLLKADGIGEAVDDGNAAMMADEFDDSAEKKYDNSQQQQQLSNAIVAILNNKRFANSENVISTIDNGGAGDAETISGGGVNYYCYNPSNTPHWKQNNVVGKKVNRLGDDRPASKNLLDQRGGDFDSTTAVAAAAAAVTAAASSKVIDEKNIYNSVVFQNKFSSSKYDLAAIAQAANGFSCKDDVGVCASTAIHFDAPLSSNNATGAYRPRSQSFDGLLDQVTKQAFPMGNDRSNRSRATDSTLENGTQSPSKNGNLRQVRSLDNLDKNVATEYETAAAVIVKDDINATYASHRSANWQRQAENVSLEQKKPTKQISRDVTYVNDCVFTQMKKVKQSFKEYTEDYREIRRIRRYSRQPAAATSAGVDLEEDAPTTTATTAEHQHRLPAQRRREEDSGGNDAYYERLDPRATIRNGDTSYQYAANGTKSQPYATTNSCNAIGQNSPSGLVTTVGSMLTAAKTIDNNCNRLGTIATSNSAVSNTAVAVTPTTATSSINEQTSRADSATIVTTTTQNGGKTGCDETTTKEHGKNNTQPKSGAQSFLEEGVYPTKPPSSFEIDREKLRQWDLMSSAPVAMLDAIQKYPLLETLASQTNQHQLQQQQQLSQLRENIIQMTDNISNSIALINSPALDLNCANGPDQMSRTDHAQVLPNLLSPVTRNKDECRLEAGNRTNETEETNSVAVAKQLSSGSPDLVRVLNSEENLCQNAANAIEGEISGNTHEELILLLIKLRRQNVNIYKAIESCHLEIERQARSIQMEKLNKVTDINKLKELKSHLNDLEKQYEKGKPLVNLVDNMVKLGSLYKHYLPNNSVKKSNDHSVVDPSFAEKIKFNDAVQEQRLLDEEHKEWQRVNADDNQLQAKIEELYKLDQELQRESTLLQNLKQDKDLLEYALGGLKSKIRDTFRNSQEMERYTRQQSALESELGHVRSVLAKNSQKLEEMVTTNARLETELTILRQKLRTQLDCASNQQRATTAVYSENYSVGSMAHNNTPGVVRALENELKRVQMIVGNLQRQRNELECQVRQLTEKSKNLYHRTDHAVGGSSKTTMAAAVVAKTNPLTDRFENQAVDCENRWFESSHLDLEDSSSSNAEPMVDVGSSDSRQQNQHILYPYCDDDIESNDHLDNKTKQFYGIIPREKCQEIKTVRIVKRESERRHKDRDRCSTNTGVPINAIHIKRPSTSTIQDENLIDNLVSMRNAQMGGIDGPRMNDEYSENASPSTNTEEQRSNNTLREISTAGNKTKTNSITERECDQNASPRLSPVLYQSNAAKEIVRELVLSKGDAKTVNNNARRANGDVRKIGTREKRRHHTISHSKPIPFLQNFRNDIRCRDDVDLERELRGPRLNTTPDVVKSTLHKTDSMKYDPETIDSLFGRPKKISIPERYVPENVPELSAEEQTKRLKKTEAIRKMLSHTSAVEAATKVATTSPTADLVEDDAGHEMDDERSEKRISNKISANKLEENKRERDYILQLNQILAQQVMEKSKLVAGNKKS